MTINRDTTRAIVRKIRALRSKRTTSGATEAEAVSAAEAAARLMEQYRIDEADIDAADYDRTLLRVKGVNLNPDRSHPMVYAAPGIAHLTGCDISTNHSGIYVVGDEVGREMAEYLFDLVRNVLDAAWAGERVARRAEADRIWRQAFKVPLPETPDKGIREIFRNSAAAFDGIARRSYMLAMAMRMSERMRAMPPARRVPEAAIERIMADTTPAAPRKSNRTIDGSAYLAGDAAGATAPIGMGVNGTTNAARQIATSRKD